MRRLRVDPVISQQDCHAVGRAPFESDVDETLGVVSGLALPGEDIRDLILAHVIGQTVGAQQQSIGRPQLHVFDRDLGAVSAAAEPIWNRTG